MKLRLILFFTAVIYTIIPAFARYDMTMPVEGKTIADEELQFQVTKKLYKITAHEYPACSDYSIKNTQIIHYPYDVKKKKNKYISGYWKEMWTVNVCDSSVQIPVTFYINPFGASYYIDKSLLKP